MPSPRLAIVLLIIIALGASITLAYAMPQKSISTSIPSASGAFLSEVVAASDSKGRVHALWTGKGSTSTALGETLLWYSNYDPETEGARIAYVVDNAPSIYSVGLTIDGHDSVHAVWVSTTDSFETVPGVRQAVNDQRRLNIVNYLRIDAVGVVPGPRTLLFGSPSESIWVSVTSAGDSGPYLAWTDVHRVSPTREESATYYTSLRREDTPPTALRTLVAKSENPSRMLRATMSAEQNRLYLAWVDELGDGRSGIGYSSVDLSNRIAKTVEVDEVDGDIDRLTLTTVREGFVLIGWTYATRSQQDSILGVARLASDETTLATDVDIRLPQNIKALESMAIDSSGNIHIVWAEVREVLHVGPGPARVGQTVLHHAVVDVKGRFSEEERTPFHLPITAAFVAEGGDVYVISGGAVLPFAQPTLASNPLILLPVLVVCACFIGGMRTEAGSYLLARWKTRGPPSKKQHAMRLSEGLETKIVRRIGAHPGIALFELRAVTSLGTLDLASRLRLLEASGMIHSFRQGTKQRFYCLDSTGPEKPRANEARSSIIRLVEEEPGITETNIARRLGMSQQLANYHLKLLGKAMVLFSRREEGRVSYFLNERAIPPLRKGTKPADMQDVYKWRRATSPS